MPNAKSVTIKLTEKQRAQIKRATGEEHEAVKFERASLGDKTAGKKLLSGRVSAKQLLSSRVAGKKVLSGRTATKKVLSGRVSAKRMTR